VSETMEEVRRSGYLSETSKKHFTVVTGVLGVVFFLLQFVVPFAAMIVFMPAFMLHQTMVTYDVRGACLFHGLFYVVQTEQKLNDPARAGSHRLVRLGAGGIEPVADLGSWSPSLVARADGIWLVSPDEVGWYDGSALRRTAAEERLGDISRPILVGGWPAVAEVRPDSQRLLIWTGRRWSQYRPLAGTGKTCCFQLLDSPAGILLFREDGDTLYVRDLDRWQEGWRAIASSPSSWYAFARAGEPAVAVFDEARGFRILGLEGQAWTNQESATWIHVPERSFAVAQPRAGDPLRVLESGFPGSLLVRTWQGGKLDQGTPFGSGGPFPPSFVLLMLAMQLSPALLSLLLAILLSSLMRANRICDYEHDGRRVPQASLTRRAIAQLVDAAFLLAPVLLVVSRFFSAFATIADGPRTFVRLLVLMAAAIAWAILLVALFAFTEGRWGVTPGKWLAGIRVVGTDLAPCGFGRGLVRNLLKFADGFFNFLVGILMVAFTPDWQRLGDLAARTIVIRAPVAGLRDRHALGDGSAPGEGP
jgi:uncharacterized RDD family membrane protein YckC